MPITIRAIALASFVYLSFPALGQECARGSAEVYSADEIVEQVNRIDDFIGMKGVIVPSLRSCVIDRRQGSSFKRTRVTYGDETTILVEDFINHLSIITLRYKVSPAIEKSTKVKLYVRGDKEQKYKLLMESSTSSLVREPRISHSYPHSNDAQKSERYHVLLLIEGNAANLALYGITYLTEKVAEQ